jgi:uncharacterized LabA/DUF88 family protein
VEVLGWQIDYKKLHKYLRDKYGVSKIFYFGGIELHNYKYDYLSNETVPLNLLQDYFISLLKDQTYSQKTRILNIESDIKKVAFYRKLETFGYKLYIKPVKLYPRVDGTVEKKANCDVDMTFHLMMQKDQFSKVIILSGDGDFLPVLKYLKENNKEIIILSRSERTANEIKKLAGNNFRDFIYLKNILKMET